MHSGYENDRYMDDVFNHERKNCRKRHDTCYCKQHEYNNEYCVQDVLRAILKAQRKAKGEDQCQISCENAINDLLGKKRSVKKNTIPFILYCGCEPYKGTGVATYSCSSKQSKRFKCIESYIFKIKELNGNCAILELLAFECDLKYTADSYGKCGLTGPCSQIDNKYVKDLRRTGICINVDLSYFSSVSCMPAIYL